MGKTVRPTISIKPKPVDTILEVTAYLTLALLWVYVIALYQSLPDIVPIHFTAGGKPDGYGSKEMTFMAPAVATILFALITFLQRKPHSFNYITEITTENAERQYSNAVRMMRALKLCICILFIVIEYTTNLPLNDKGEADLKWIFIGGIFIVQLPLSYFLIQSLKKE